MARHNVDLIAGYDNQEYVYDEKQEKSYHATIWVCIGVFMALVLLRGIILHVEEQYLKAHGQCIEAVYDADAMQAYYINESGRHYQFDLRGYAPALDGENVRLYYRTNIYAAQPENALIFWLAVYAGLGGALGFCIWRIAKIYRQKKKYSKPETEE